MTSIFYTGILSILWVVNLFNGTGLDSVYHITEYTRIIVLALCFFNFLLRSYNEKKIVIKKNDFIIFSSMILLFFLSSTITGHVSQTFDYLCAFALTYLISRLELDEKVFLWTGIIYGVGGAFILYTYDFGTALNGWNENSIAMLGMHSFLVMLIPLFKKMKFNGNAFLIIVTLVFGFLISFTDSRSGMLFMAIGTLFALNVISRNVVFGKSGRITIFLLIPLIIAIVVVIVSGTPLFEALESWSFRKFNKPIFNGRDMIWRDGFEILFNNFLIGNGLIGNGWHNSAITCLAAYGCVGYLFWISSFNRIINFGLKWLDDYIIQGCIVSFIVLYMQQSVELGLISTSPSLIPYVMLGMMLGRARYLEKNEGKQIA